MPCAMARRDRRLVGRGPRPCGRPAAAAVAEAPPRWPPSSSLPCKGPRPPSRSMAMPQPRAQPFSLPSLIPPTWRTALGALRRNKMRSALTALGVIIGVGAVIAMTEIGEGSKAAVQKSIASMGANNLLVLPGAAMSGGVSYGAGSRPTLTPEDGEQLAQQCPAISDFAPIVQTHGPVGLRPNQLEDPVRRRHHAQLPQRPRLDRHAGGRSLFRPRRAECQ